MRAVREPLQTAGDDDGVGNELHASQVAQQGRGDAPELHRPQMHSLRARYSAEEVDYYCPVCGYHDGILDVQYDYVAVQEELNAEALAGNREPSMWRYLPLLPVNVARPDSSSAGGLDADL